MGFFSGITKSIGKVLKPVSSLVGPVIGAVTSGLSASRAEKEAKRNRDFQLAQSNTAHQREVADLRAAGLNPILSAGGRGASTPGGSAAAIPDLSRGLAAGASAAYGAASAKNATITADLRGDMLDFYRSDPNIKAATNAAMLSKEAGIPPVYPAAANALKNWFGSSAKGMKKWFEGYGITKPPTSLAPSRSYPLESEIPDDPDENKAFWDEFWKQSRQRGYKMQRN